MSVINRAHSAPIRPACSYPSCQRRCAASAAHSGKTKGNAAGAASLQDISAVLARPANAAARLALRAQAGRKATPLARLDCVSAEMQGVRSAQAGRKEYETGKFVGAQFIALNEKGMTNHFPTLHPYNFDLPAELEAT